MTDPASASDRIETIHHILSEEPSDDKALERIREVLYPADLPPATAPPMPPVMDKGLTSWVTMFRSQLGSQPGVELLESSGTTVAYRFRGQTFALTVTPT